MCIRDRYLITLPADALSAAAPGSLAVLPRCNSVKVSGTVTSHTMGLPHAYGINVVLIVIITVIYVCCTIRAFLNLQSCLKAAG